MISLYPKRLIRHTEKKAGIHYIVIVIVIEMSSGAAKRGERRLKCCVDKDCANRG